MTIRVGVLGAAGRMGSEVCRTIAAAQDLHLVAAVDPDHIGARLEDVAGVAGEIVVGAEVEDLAAAGAEVTVDFTHPSVVADNTVAVLERGIHAVVGTTGMGAADLDRVRASATAGSANAFIAPNFAIGAVLMMRFAAEAARYLPDVEIIELHHDRKADAPSGTALRTAELIEAARTDHADPVGGDDLHRGARGTEYAGLRIHSVRLPGLVAHQEVLLGGQGQTLTIRHDSSDRTSFMPGVLLAVRRVADLDGLVVGLEHLLERDTSAAP